MGPGPDLGSRSQVTVVGIGGNEAAVTLVKRATVFMGPERFCEISRFVANQVI